MGEDAGLQGWGPGATEGEGEGEGGRVFTCCSGCIFQPTTRKELAVGLW